jgi:4-phytase/acid phosphatase
LAKMGRHALLLVSVCALAWRAPVSQTNSISQTKSAARKPAAGSASERLKMVVILSRHGVRSPTWTQERLDGYSALPWPKWGVPPADLTNRGYELIKQFGSFDRMSLAGLGLFPANGCAGSSKTYIWADTDQRTVASGRAFAEGFFPGCPPVLHSLAAGENDPLFHPTANGVKPAQADAAFAEFAARAKQQTDPHQDELLTELQHVLLGCAPNPKIACTPTHKPEMALLGAATAPVRGKGDHIVDLEGPLPQGSSFSEDLLLEYADGMAMEQVGWGKVDEPELRRLLALHSDYFDLMHRTPALAKLEASNMLFHIARTLKQGVEGQAVDGAIGPADTELVVLAGHDTNLAGVAALLGLHWTLDGRKDDTPPGTELAFELWQDAHGGYSVRLNVAMQTLRQLRDMPALTLAAPPAHAALMLPGCAAGGCAWDEFQRIADAAVDRDQVLPAHAN